MTIRQDSSKEIVISSTDNVRDRAELRKLMLCTFITEDCKTKYRYIVETLTDGTKIYIERPGRLNKGCDFVIYVENLSCYKNGNDIPPRHDDLLDDLRNKKNYLSPSQFATLIEAIKDIYGLQSFNAAIAPLTSFPSNNDWSYELILKLVRWFFIEQDITYWANSGRTMLWNEIQKI